MTRLSAIALLALAGCVAQPVSKPAAPAGAGEQVVTAQTVASNAEAASAIGGSAVCQIANCNYTIIPTGTGWTKSNWNI